MAFAYCTEKQIVEVHHRLEAAARLDNKKNDFLLGICVSNGFYVVLSDTFKKEALEILKDIFKCEIEEAQKYVFDEDRLAIQRFFGFELLY